MKFSSIKKEINLILSGALLLFVGLAFSSCDDDNDLNAERQWQLVWEDDFNGSAGDSVDPSNWNFDIGNGCDDAAGCGWGNAELQYYTDRPENISLDGQGNLAITAKRENFGGAAYTSARITTKGKFEQQYGRMEARIKMPWGPGLWPAFWMLGSNIDVVEWPQSGEIDIVEYRGQEPNLVHGSVHGPGYSGGNSVTKLFGFENDRFDTDFHIFAVEWGENYIDYFVDDTRYFRIQPEDVPGEWVYNQSFYLLLNMAVGGNFVGFPAPGTDFPQTMFVDYIRVYRELNQ
jgi:beta-glucanase (GH16 family)